MMKECEIKAWRDTERDRLPDLVDVNSKLACNLLVNILTRVLEDD